MLRRSHRLNSRQFDEIIKSGRVTHSPLFIARILATKNSETAKIAAVVPVKVGKTSAIRHKVRRRIYEAARHTLKDVKPGHLVALFAKQTALDIKPAQLSEEIKALFVKAGILLKQA